MKIGNGKLLLTIHVRGADLPHSVKLTTVSLLYLQLMHLQMQPNIQVDLHSPGSINLNASLSHV